MPTFPFLFSILLCWTGVGAQDSVEEVPFEGTNVLIDDEDSPDDVVRKAAQVRPSARQVAWQALEFTAFVHFGMNTFTDREWGNGQEEPDQFAPTEFDARQWVRAFKEAGMRGVVLTCKHHDGFCLWQTDTTEHSIKNSSWRNGQGDVVRDVAEACREFGLKFGVYLSPWDRNTKEFGKPGYNEIFQQQLRELLTRYGDVYDVWFDGAHAPGDNPEVFDWSAHFRLIRELQPQACISVKGPDVRWCGNEAGHTRATEWNVVPIQSRDLRPASESQETTEAIVKHFNPQAQDLGSRLIIHSAQQLMWRPAMTNTSIRPGWFYHASQDNQVRSLKNLLDIYYGSVGGNTQFLLNIPPDRRGLIHENDVERLREIGMVLERTFATNLAAGAEISATTELNPHDTEHTVDGNANTYWAADPGATSAVLEYQFEKLITFNVIALQEFIARGQRIEAFEVDAWSGQAWKTVAAATTVGYKRLLRTNDTTTNKIRLRILESRLGPTLSEFGLYRAPAILAPPRIHRTLDGFVSLSAIAGAEIRYTLDGLNPNADSALYEGPFQLPRGGTVRALVIPQGNTLDFGASAQAEYGFGLAKSGWSIAAVDSEEPNTGATAEKAIDDDPETFWHTQWQEADPDYPHEIVIDLGKEEALSGFGYLPRQDGADGGLVSRYEIHLSLDGVQWQERNIAGSFDNVLNNPVLQRIDFAEGTRARFVRFVALSSPNGKPWAGAAEIELFAAHDSTRSNR